MAGVKGRGKMSLGYAKGELDQEPAKATPGTTQEPGV